MITPFWLLCDTLFLRTKPVIECEDDKHIGGFELAGGRSHINDNIFATGRYRLATLAGNLAPFFHANPRSEIQDIVPLYVECE